MTSSVAGRLPVQAKRGTKQTCKNETCGSRYYDLNRAPPACPYCGAFCDTPAVIRVDFETLGKLRPHKYKRWVEAPKPPAEVSKVEDDEAVEEQVDKEADIPSAAEDLLIEMEEEDEAEPSVETTSEIP